MGLDKDSPQKLKAFLLVGGRGTRLKPLTDNTPKCLLPINGSPLLQIWLEHLLRTGVDEVLINCQLDKLEHYIDGRRYTEHNPRIGDGLSALRSALSDSASNRGITVKYDKMHRLLAEGSFVLSVSEGYLNGVHSSFYDLFSGSRLLYLFTDRDFEAMFEQFGEISVGGVIGNPAHRHFLS